MRKLFFTLLTSFLILTTVVGQNILRGKITDEEGNPISGVSVLEKGSVSGTSSNSEGFYQLKYSGANSIAIFRYLGFATQEIMINGRTELNVNMKSEGITLEGLTIVGSRSPNRSATSTPVPIDVINIAKVTNSVGQIDMNQLMQFVVPSFNSNRQTGSDGADHVDPASLRGLGPDQTLVLINGKRRHQSSLINLFGTRGRGNTGTDLNTIPAASIERIEILRDGASAQYGSDAIAGVINVVLKNSVDEFAGNINLGVNSEGDGENLGFNGNYGAKIGKKGFVNVTGDYLYRDRTNRAENPADFADPASDVPRRFYGDALVESFTGMFNSQIDISDKAQFYAFGGISTRFGNAYAFTRYPESERNVPEIYPNGFDPQIISNIRDRSISAGIKGDIHGWNVDFNNTFGINRFDYFVDKTLNTSLGIESPTRFAAGGFQLSQNTLTLNFTRYFENTLAVGTNFAFGSEFRSENYQIFAGEEASWRGYTDQAAGSQGFPGFQPGNEVNENRTNLGVYADVEFNFSRQFLIATAARFERYNDFGNSLTGKLAARYTFSPAFTFRGSVSTGFRAPSLAQIYFNTSYTNVIGGVPEEVLLAKNNSNITRTLEVEPLKQEKTINASLGFTSRPSNSLTLTIDGYYIKIEDRIVLTGDFSRENAPELTPDLDAFNVSKVKFFTNALDTETYGLDAVLTWSQNYSGHDLSVSYAANFNELKPGAIKTSERLQGREDIYFDGRERAFLIASAPKSKMNLIFDYRYNRFNANLRFVRFDKLQLLDYKYEEFDEYDAKITTDLTLGFLLNKNFSFSIGGSNLFNVLPNTSDAVNSESGGIYEPVQMGFNGIYLFSRLSIKF
ncbi:TonB-dependent receptor [Flavihumibacter sp. R14]|nr:TonB-dependent receptor [Flavihumibacter soli]